MIMANAIMYVILTLAIIVVWTVALSDGRKQGMEMANRAMLQNCFDDSWVLITVDNSTYSFNCNTSKGYGKLTHN